MTIDDKTKISFYTLMAAVPFVVSGIMWVSSISSMAQENRIVNNQQEKRLDAQRDNIKEQRDILIEIRGRLIRIETHMGIK